MKKKEKRYGLFKGIILCILIAVVLSWLIPNGAFSSTGFSGDGSLTRVGLNDLSWIIYYGIYFSIDKIVLLLAIGGLYGVLVKTSAYDKLVTGIAKKLVKHKKLFVVLFSLIIAALTSLLTQSFTVIIFIPFIISIMNRMKLDKMTILATTFGSMLVGTLGATYGTEGLAYFNQYLTTEGVTINSTILVRAGILVIGLVLFNFFTLSHMKNVAKNEETTDMFVVENVDESKSQKKGNITPLIFVDILMVLLLGLLFIGITNLVVRIIIGVVLLALIACNVFAVLAYRKNKDKVSAKLGVISIVTLFAMLFIIVILGYVNWQTNFGITIFNEFHEILTKVNVGEDFYIIESILGTNMGAFGTWDLFSIAAIVFVFTILLGLCYRVKTDDFISNYAKGAEKMLKPILCVILAFTLMVVVYMSPYVATILNKLLSLTDGFNLATMSLSALIANIFHTDLGYTAYIMYSYLTTEFADYINPIYVIFVSLYGFVQFFIPTSITLGVGLTGLDVKYCDWLKYIWRFLIGMIICLLIIFILMAVI